MSDDKTTKPMSKIVKSAADRHAAFEEYAAQREVRQKQPKEPKKNGRPTIYTPELAAKICSAIENGVRGIEYLCKVREDFPVAETVRQWLFHNKHPEFTKNYALAKKRQADAIADEIVDVSYEAKLDKYGRVEKPKLMVSALTWAASKLAPRKYGEVPVVEEEVKKPIDSLSEEERIAKIAGIFVAAKERIEKDSSKK